MKRRPAGKGLSYFDANSNSLVTEGPDILEVKSEIQARWPGVFEVWFDATQEEWVIVEKCKDGVERFVMKTPALSMATVDKLQRIDQAAHIVEDPIKELERQEAKAEREYDHRISEAFGEGHERLAAALARDGVGGIPQVFFANKEKAA